MSDLPQFRQITQAADTPFTPPTLQREVLLLLGKALKAVGYTFTTVSPATHQRVNSRAENAQANDLRDVFGWSRPFQSKALSAPWLSLLQAAGILYADGELWRSKLRVSSLDEHLYFHSAYPTDDDAAVFFGPDTYRFIRAIKTTLATLQRGKKVLRAVDIGCGAGPGALALASTFPAAQVWATDINPHALQLTAINAQLAGLTNVYPLRSAFFNQLEGEFDLIVANPPYLLDQKQRSYRHGAGQLGEQVSLQILDAALMHLSPGGTLLLYTGAPILNGYDPYESAFAKRFAGSGLVWHYSEIDPDVFGEELEQPAYAHAERIAAVVLTVHRPLSHTSCTLYPAGEKHD